MKKLFLSLILSVISLTIFAQIATIKWYYTDGAHTYNKSGTLDMQYGRTDRGVVPPYKLALEVDGEYLTGEAALAELQKPIWGTQQNLPFIETIPTYERSVPEYIYVSNWKTFPDAAPLNSEGLLYNLRVELAPGKYKNFQNASYDPYWWGIIAPVEWKLTTEPSAIQVQNPDYVQYQEDVMRYEQVLSETFTQMGTYIFPSLKLIDGVVWLIKYEGETTWTNIPVDPLHPLASTTGGYIYKLLPTREYELKPWSVYVSSTLLVGGDLKLKRLLGIQ